ncbi:MAG TPA: nucleoside phosphorylase [Cyclobacteriaceae bacterium]|nr:nucleoside phosphorylase [Cyclobacteriaceae bacterium]
MEDNRLAESEFVLNADGSVYHLHLRAEHIADTVLLVGDQGRVAEISKHFDVIDHQSHNREFVTHTGTYRGKRITALSTGIGTDNIDIVVNELDAAVNINPATRTPNPVRRKLTLVRLGTSGALQPDIPVGTFLLSEFGMGLDGLIYYYNYQPSQIEKLLTEKLNAHLRWNPDLSTPYVVAGAPALIKRLEAGTVKGITATATGFYGPQGRRMSLVPRDPGINDRLQAFAYEHYRVTNFEMETSALYALGSLLGHDCCTICVIIANRIRKEFGGDHSKHIESLITTTLDKLNA